MDPGLASQPQNYHMSSYTYLLHSPYGSPETDTDAVAVRLAQVSGDGLEVELVCDGLREGYVHELRLDRLRDAEDEPLLHPRAYYTLIEIPEAGDE